MLGLFISEIASAAKWTLPCGVVIDAPGYYDYIEEGYSRCLAEEKLMDDALFYLEVYCEYKTPSVEFED